MLVHRGSWNAHELKNRIDYSAEQGVDLARVAQRFVSAENIVIDVDDPEETYCFMDGVHAQCGMVQLFQFYIGENGKMRNLLANGEAVAKWLGYTKMMITLTSDQRHKAAREYGFVEIDSFVNRRTQNTVYVLTKEIAY